MATDVSAHLEAAQGFYRAGRLTDAAREVGIVLDQDPENQDANVLDGVLSFKRGEAEAALQSFERVLDRTPLRHDALVWAGVVLRSKFEFAKAIELLERAHAQAPDDLHGLNLLGLCRLAVGQGTLAEDAFRRAITIDPGSAQAHHNLGLALRLQNRNLDALDELRRALKLEPEQPANTFQVARQLQQLSRPDEALACLKEGVRKHPKSTILAEALASAYGHSNQAREAEAIFERIAPVSSSASITYANWLLDEGRFSEAIGALRTSIRLQPVQGEAYHSLSNVKLVAAGDPNFGSDVTKLLLNPRLDARARMHLFYALGNIHDAHSEYRDAMENYDRANELAYRSHPTAQTFSPAENDAFTGEIMQLYSKELLSRLGGTSLEAPIFIVGMIRSGTTLLDRVLSNHPSVRTLGELPFWNVEGGRTHAEWRAQGPSAEDVARLALRYEGVIAAPPGAASRAVDKMPLNFLHLGLISLAFPKAKFIHLRRSPLDTCLSIYTTYFGDGPHFTYNQLNIVAFYRSYLRLMAHWRAMLPKGQLYELHYEDIVGDPEPTIRGLLDHCELPWDSGCLQPERSSGTVSTPSRWQARQPIYRTSLERWRRYEPFLGALSDLAAVSHPG